MFFRGTLVLAAMSAVFVGWAQQPASMQTVLLRDVRLIDGTGAPAREHVSLLLRNGRIEKIGETTVVASGGQVRERAGKTVMPGLISAHSDLGLFVDDA